MRALEKEPGQRFQSADAFIAALDAALKDPRRRGGQHRRLRAAAAGRRDAGGGGRRGRPEEEEARRRRRRIWLLVAAAVLIGLLVGFALTRDTTHRGAQRHRQPAQRGDRAAAAERLQRRRNQAGRARSAGEHVLEQDPAASPPADEASLDCAFLSFFCSKPKVMLTVSAGPGSAKVPSTAGLTVGRSRRSARRSRLQSRRSKRVHSEEVEEGLVIHSEPSGGRNRDHGAPTSLLTVSSGPKLAKVPVLVGTQRSVAVQQIRGRGFSPSVEEDESSKPAGEVIRQAPSAGSQLPPGSTVSIVVSKGEEKATVPNVIGKLRAEAVEAVRAAGLKPVVQEQETEVPSQVGRVTDQFPPPGSEVKPGAHGDAGRRQGGDRARSNRKRGSEE